MGLHLTLEAGDAVRIGTDTIVRVKKKSGNKVSLDIDSEYRIKLERGELERPTTKAHAPPISRPRVD